MKKIMYIGSEVMPYCATGGLGDVLGSLPKAIKKRLMDDVQVSVVMPLYKRIKDEYKAQMKEIATFTCNLAWRQQYCGIKTFEKDSVTYYFIDNEYYFGRDNLYGYYDDGERFAFFSKAVADMMPVIDYFPDIINANDWQSAMTVVYLKRLYKDDARYNGIKTVFTIHNIEYQGKFDPYVLGDLFGLPNEELQTLEYDGCLNLMKGAVECADLVNTVSETYANEIKGEEKSFGLSHILQKYDYKLRGILNGIDYDYYNPATDDKIQRNYTWRSPLRKLENKNALQRETGLCEKDVPMIAVISRLVSHKGMDIVRESIGRILSCYDVQFVLLGTGDKEYEDFFLWLEREYKDKCRALITYDRDLSKRIYAACDVFLMPSKSEPCGLSQMIASRYGAIPVTRETGGLADSIKHFTVDEKGKLQGNGFTFYDYNSDVLFDKLAKAVEAVSDKDTRKKLASKVMREDFSFEASAEKYIEMYNSL